MSAIDRMMEQIRELEDRIEAELEKRREAFRYRLDHDRVVFERDIRRRHRELRVRFLTFLSRARPMVILTAPFIYAVIIGFVVLDVLASLYQSVCFPVYGIRKVTRRDYIIFDRHQLAYLNALQKLNCLYCAYANGLLAYVSEIASRTEQFWCPIKHARRGRSVHTRYTGDLENGDCEGFAAGLIASRKNLRDELEAGD